MCGRLESVWNKDWFRTMKRTVSLIASLHPLSMIHPSRQQTGSASFKKWTPHRFAPLPPSLPHLLRLTRNQTRARRPTSPQGRKQLGGRLSNVTKTNARDAHDKDYNGDGDNLCFLTGPGTDEDHTFITRCNTPLS